MSTTMTIRLEAVEVGNTVVNVTWCDTNIGDQGRRNLWACYPAPYNHYPDP